MKLNNSGLDNRPPPGEVHQATPKAKGIASWQGPEVVMSEGWEPTQDWSALLRLHRKWTPVPSDEGPATAAMWRVLG